MEVANKYWGEQRCNTVEDQKEWDAIKCDGLEAICGNGTLEDQELMINTCGRSGWLRFDNLPGGALILWHKF